MNKTIDKLIDDIIELVVEDMDCQHEVDHDEGGAHTSVEYNLKYEQKVRGKILALLKPQVTEEWIEEKAKKAWSLWWYKASGQDVPDFNGTIRFDFQGVKNLIRSLVKEK